MFNFLKTRLFFFFMDYLEMWYWIYTSRDISLLTIVDTVLNAWLMRHYVPLFLNVQNEGLIGLIIWGYIARKTEWHESILALARSVWRRFFTSGQIREMRNGAQPSLFSHYSGALNSWDDPIHIQGESSTYPPWKHFQKHTQKFVSRRFRV